MWSAGASSKRISYVSAITDHAGAKTFSTINITSIPKFIKDLPFQNSGKCVNEILSFLYKTKNILVTKNPAEAGFFVDIRSFGLLPALTRII